MNATAWWPTTLHVIGVAALMLIYIVYFLPKSIQRRLKVKAIT